MKINKAKPKYVKRGNLQANKGSYKNDALDAVLSAIHILGTEARSGNDDVKEIIANLGVIALDLK